MKPDSNGRLLAGVAFACAAILMGACASNTSAEGPGATDPTIANHVVVKITFDAQGCPLSADPDTFDVTKSKKIAWQAIDASGNPVAPDYTIYFDPFNGRPLEGKKGSLLSPPFDKKAPATAAGIEYKYSIVGVSCPNAPLDPRFRLR